MIIGFVAIRDDVRPEARQAIASVQRAGIQVVMITGDQLETAASIARDAGLLQSNDDLAITSAQLNRLSDDEVKKIVPRIRVIARALPTDKSRMVRLCQEMGLVVGMTGDGVNDSPALKRADVGFAMGSGTQAAKEAGKIVILDDNFKSIRDAIWYGRTIYHNILKFCKFQLTINLTAVVVSAIAPFFGVDEPLQVTHLLFVNLVMDGLGAMMLGSEPAQKAYMREKPRRRDESIISRPMAAQVGAAGLWLTVLSFFFLKASCLDGLFQTMEQRLTAYFVLFIWSALFNGFNVRDEGGHIFRGLNENRGLSAGVRHHRGRSGGHRQRGADARAGLAGPDVPLCALCPGGVGRSDRPGRRRHPSGPAPQGRSGPAAPQGPGAGRGNMKIS